MILNFLYVCQSVSWLTSLLKLGKYRDISCYGWDIFDKIFWRPSWNVFTLFLKIKILLYVCLSVSWLTSLLILNKYEDISSSQWDIFLKFFGDIYGILVHFFQKIWNLLERVLGCFYPSFKHLKISCMSVSLLVGLLTYWN